MVNGTYFDNHPEFQGDRIILKYNLDEQTIVYERIEEILDVQIQDDTLVAWVLANKNEKPSCVKFSCIGTGWPINYDVGAYLTTIQDGALVWHVFVDAC